MESRSVEQRISDRSKTGIWEIELKDLKNHHSFLGYSLGAKYLMVSITSPTYESQISVNALQTNDEREVRIPLLLDKCDSRLTGSLLFTGVEEIEDRWRVFFVDNRFNEEVEVIDSSQVQLQRVKQTAREMLMRSLRLDRKKESGAPLFELRLLSKSN